MCASRGNRSHEPQFHLPVAIFWLKGIANITLTHTHTHTHSHMLSKEPGGINWTLEKQLNPLLVKCLSQLNKHCTNPVSHLHRNSTTIIQTRACTPTLHSPKVRSRIFGSFANTLSLLSLSSLVVFAKLLNGSLRVDTYLNQHLLLLEKGCTQPLDLLV